MIRRTPAAAAVLALLALGACTDDEAAPPEPERTRDGGNTGALLDPDAPAPAPDLPAAEPGGDITILSTDAPRTFDPTRASSADAIAILQLVTRSLTQYRYDPRSGRSVLVPDLATDLGRHNMDFTEWTFTMRSGLRYSDGTTVSARDIAYAVKRSFADRELPGGAPFNRLFFLAGQTYQGPYRDRPDYDGVEVRGRQVTIRMARPFVDLPYYAALPAFTAIPRSADREPDDYGDSPLATGPYQFESYRPGDRLVLSRNPHWDPRTDPARHAYVDSWTFEWGVDAVRRDTVLVQDEGAGQTTASYDDVLADTVAVVQQDEELEQRLATGRSRCTFSWQLDTRRVRSLIIRRAIGYAYPYREAWRAGGLVEGVTRLPATALLPPGTAGRVEYDVLGIEGANTDPDRARELLARLGKIGYELRFPYEADDPTSVAVKDARVAGLERAGFTAVPVPTTSNARSRTQAPAQAAAQAPAQAPARVDVWDSRSCPAWPTGSSWLPNLRRTASSFLDRPDVERRIDGLLAPDSGSAAGRDWGRLDRYLQTTYYPAVTLGYAGRASMHGSRVGGMAIDEVYGMPTYPTMYVLPDADNEEE